MDNHKIIVILGPTSSGKSEVAIKLAQKFNGEIISADSRQIYRGMDVGTGKVPESKCKSQNVKLQLKDKKITPYWSSGIAHYLIDIVNPKTEYNIADFKKDANYVINYVIRKNKTPIICGGTGFWIKAVVDNINFPEVKPNKKLRKTLEKKTVEKLFKMLQKLDAERARNIDPKNKVRLIRAIEICQKLGKVPSLNYESKIMDYEYLQIGLAIEKKKLYQKIKKRLEKRFGDEMIEEVKKLRQSGLSWKKIESFGLGYYWISLYLQNKLRKKHEKKEIKTTKSCDSNKLLSNEKWIDDREGLFEKIYLAEKNYAKRQMTWFRKDKRIIWLKNYRKIEKTARKFIGR